MDKKITTCTILGQLYSFTENYQNNIPELKVKTKFYADKIVYEEDRAEILALLEKM